MDDSTYIDKKPSKAKTIWLILVILALVASSVSFTLFYLKQKSEIDTLKAQNSKLADDNKSLESENNKVVVPQGEYRDIPELGVKYKVTDETKDVTYSFKYSEGGGTIGSKGYIGISTQALTLAAPENAKNSDAVEFDLKYPCTSVEDPVATIFKSEESDTSGLVQEKKLGKFYYQYAYGKLEGSNKCSQEEHAEAIKSGQAIFKSLELIELDS